MTASGARNTSRLTAAIAAGLVVVHGLTVLVGWWLGWGVLVSPPEQFIPMAPSTALAFAVVGAAWLARTLRPGSAEVRGAVHLTAWLITSLMAVNLLFPARFDAFLGGSVGTFGAVPLGVMSPITAAALLAVSASMVLVERAQAPAGVLATAAAVVGAAVGLGYLYGTPLLYGTTTIPVALPTGLSLMAMGVAVLALIGPAAWPLRPFVGTTPKARMLRAFLPATVLLVLVIGFFQSRLRAADGANDVIFTAWIALAGIVLMTVMVSRLAHRMGEELESAWTQRNRAEQRYRTIFENVPAGIAETSLDGRILLCNAALAEMFSTSAADFASRRAQDYYWDSEDRERILAGLHEAGELHDVELRMRRPDGEPVWLLANVRLHEVPGEEPVIETAALDVSGRKMLEEQLWRAQKLDALGSLAGGVAHDFNNVLTSIIASAELLRSAMGEDDERVSDLLEIERSCRRAAGLTRQLLAFSSRQPFDPRPLRIDEHVRDLESMLQRLLGSPIRCVTLIDDDLAPVWADPTQIEQVIVNLAVNARDAMPTGGTLEILARNAAVSPDDDLAAQLAPGSYVVLSVRDTGHGMSAETLARVFEPFFTTKASGKGTGLGLATVWGIIKQSRGHVRVRSTPDIGTTVECFFPTTDEPIRQIASAGLPPRLDGSETILLVEDEESILSAAATKLRSHGYVVITAADGSTARTIVDTHRGAIHLVVSDGVLSDVRVPELLKRLRASRPDTRILIMSGYAEESIYGDSAVDPGAPFLAKPFSLHDLTVRVRQVLDEKRPS